MSENLNAITSESAPDYEIEGLVLKLNKPYSFEGTEYSEIDLSALEDWSAVDLKNARAQYKKLNGDKEENIVTEMSMIEAVPEYQWVVSSMATKLPVEFFMQLPAKASRTLGAAIINFFLN